MSTSSSDDEDQVAVQSGAILNGLEELSQHGPVLVLRELQLIGWSVERHTVSAVHAARAAGVTWEAIARELHMSKQAAQQRFSRSPG